MADAKTTPETHSYKVTSRITHDGKTYDEGDAIELTPAQAEALSAEVDAKSKKAVK